MLFLMSWSRCSLHLQSQKVTRKERRKVNSLPPFFIMEDKILEILKKVEKVSIIIIAVGLAVLVIAQLIVLEII